MVTDLYSALCGFEASDSARGDEKDSLGIAMQIVWIVFFWGVGSDKWLFTAFFKCNIHPYL